MTPGESAAIVCFAHTLLFGVYLTTLGHCLRWLVFDTKGWELRPKVPWLNVTVTLLLFVLSTSNTAVVLWMTLVAIAEDPSAYNATFTWSAGLGVAVLLVVDAVLIYRCWLVYAKTWLVIIFPLVLWLADFVSGVVGIVLLAPNSPWPSSIDNSTVFQYILNDNMTFLACEIVINVYVTSAIVIRILRVTRRNGGQTSGRVHEIGRIFAESGILFTSTCIVNLFFKALALNVARFQLTSGIMAIINLNAATIAFNLVLIRMAQERPPAVTDSEEPSQQPILTTFPFGTSTYSTTTDGSVIPDIEMQITSSRAIKAEEESKLDSL